MAVIHEESLVACGGVNMQLGGAWANLECFCREKGMFFHPLLLLFLFCWLWWWFNPYAHQFVTVILQETLCSFCRDDFCEVRKGLPPSAELALSARGRWELLLWLGGSGAPLSQVWTARKSRESTEQLFIFPWPWASPEQRRSDLAVPAWN